MPTPKVTLKSTKQEILDALHATEKQLAEQKKIMSCPSETAQKAEDKAVIKAAAKDVESGIFSDEMNDKFQNLSAAIAAMEKQLKERYDVDAALAEMVLVVNAKKQIQLDLDADIERRKAEEAEDQERTRRNFADEIAKMRADAAKAKADLAQAREREQEQFDYDTARKRKLDEDAYADKQAALEKKLAEAEARLAELRADTEALTKMQETIDAMPATLDAKYQEGYESGKKDAGKEYGYKSAMADKDHSYEIRERDSKIARLEADCQEKASKIAALEGKLDAAYTQLRDLATKTVESSGGVKVISTAGDGATRK